MWQISSVVWYKYNIYFQRADNISIKLYKPQGVSYANMFQLIEAELRIYASMN